MYNNKNIEYTHKPVTNGKINSGELFHILCVNAFF